MIFASDKPLVSMAMTTYNRKEYIRDALAGVFAQTYGNLEIVISDDCSTDGTWEIINEEVRKYQAAGGRHSITLNRNERNLKVLGNFEKLASLCRGDLIIQCGDDDISLPNRATRTVDAVMRAGGTEKIKLVHCGAARIDRNGRRMRLPIQGMNAYRALGAVAAYSADVFKSFAPLRIGIAYEDGVYAGRAIIMGEELTIPDQLVQYRYGEGASTSTHSWRSSYIHSLERIIAYYDQNLLDLDSRRDMLDNDRYLTLHSRCLDGRDRNMRRLELHRGDSMLVRFKNRKRIGFRWLGLVLSGHVGNLIYPIYQCLCIVPKCIGTPLLNLYVKVLYRTGYNV